jgi:hypothetical protein
MIEEQWLPSIPRQVVERPISRRIYRLTTLVRIGEEAKLPPELLEHSVLVGSWHFYSFRVVLTSASL